MNEYVKVTPQMLGGEWQQNRFWRLRVQGGLSQRHADFHNAIVMPATESHVRGDGRLCLSVDPAAVGRAMPGRHTAARNHAGVGEVEILPTHRTQRH